ncbi:hypothetical protein DID88_009598 [Monilinia fructigena]|uniref:Uncharacterized protein n=1 Tax=Monilinia fructigena TaxID=38457 RepID=A0A395IT84_9HELO|nr:hypothetical protein DID88_009598 [Monilinia fructigena]
MSRSTDPGHFFQTDASESTRARRAAKSGNKNGNPIVLQSKILSLISDPFSSQCVYIAESAGCVRKVNIETRDTKTIYRGPTAPVTSVAIGGHGGDTIFAGCWDKQIWSWDRETKSLRQECLISGGADAKIMVWNTTTGERLHTLRDKSESMMAVQDLALDPEESTNTEVVLVSSSSDPQIRRWRISLSSASQILDTTEDVSAHSKPIRDTILEHETSVYQVTFAGDEGETDLWTASADGTAKCLSRAKHWSAEETYQHGDYVRAVAITDTWIITAVTGMVILQGGKQVISISIDGTVRTWGLTKGELEKARLEREEKAKGVMKEEKVEPKKGLMTAEEEAELAELLDSDED